MTDERADLRRKLASVAAGGDIAATALRDAIPDPHALRGTERLAWHMLRRWADDADIRARDAVYARQSRRAIRDLAAAWDGEPVAASGTWSSIAGRPAGCRAGR